MPLESFCIDITAPNKDGMLPIIGRGGSQPIRSLTRRDSLSGEYILVKPSRTEFREHDAVDITGGTLEVAVGLPDNPIATGTIKWTYNAIAGTPFNVPLTVAQVSTALNAHATIIAEGGVTVTSESNDATVFRIEWNSNGVRALELFLDPFGAYPYTNATMFIRRAGSAGTREVRALTAIQAELASYNGFVVGSSAVAVGITSIQVGDAVKKAVHQIQLSGAQPYGGSFTLNTKVKQVITLACRNNKGVVELTAVACNADFASSNPPGLNGRYFDIYDDVGPVRVYYKNNGADIPPTIPTGGRLKRVTIVDDDYDWVVAQKTADTLDADAKFAGCYSSGNVAYIKDASVGSRQDGNSGTSAFEINVPQQGTNGKIAGKYFIIGDTTSTCAVWFYTAVGDEDIPAGADLADRAIKVTIAIGDSATTVAGLVQAAINADPAFTAAVSGNVVTVTTDTEGECEDKDIGTSGMAIDIVIIGETKTAQIPWNASGDEFAAEWGADDIEVTTPDDKTWLIQYKQFGPRGLPTADASALIAPQAFSGDVNLNTVSMHEYFSRTNYTADPLPAILQIRFTPASGASKVIYREEIQIYRSVTLGGVPSPLAFAAFVRINGGYLQLWNPDQNLWHSVLVRGAAGVEYLEILAGVP
jgi:hypothetical protein